jgi:hypothetical protein
LPALLVSQISRQEKAGKLTPPSHFSLSCGLLLTRADISPSGISTGIIQMSLSANRGLSEDGPGADFPFKTLTRAADDFTVEWWLPPIWQNSTSEMAQIERGRSKGDSANSLDLFALE